MEKLHFVVQKNFFTSFAKKMWQDTSKAGGRGGGGGEGWCFFFLFFFEITECCSSKTG